MSSSSMVQPSLGAETKVFNACVHELVQAQARRDPEAIALVERNVLVTYRELDERSNQLAAYLRTRGVAPEVPVAICLDRSVELVLSMLAVLKAGGACVPLDPAYPAERLNYMLQDTCATLMLTRPGLLSLQLPTLKERINFPEAWGMIARESSEPAAAQVTPKSLAHIIYTSGSTGKPRGVMLIHEGLVNHHLIAQELYGLHSSDRVLQFSSISFDIALEEIFPTLIAGATLVLRTDDVPLAARDFIQWLAQEAITVLDLPTAYWHELVHQLCDLDASLPESLRLVIVGGEKASAKALNAWNHLVKGRIRWINTYGPSEASIITTAYEPVAQKIWDIEASIPIGRPIANTSVHVLDSNLNPVAPGEAGELHIGGTGLARGYLNQPQRTAEKFIADPSSKVAGARLYKTGDIGRYRGDGELEFLGRVDDQVKIRGFRVELAEIETELAQHPAVQEAVVVVKGNEGAKKLVAYMVPQRNANSAETEIKTFLKQRLPEYMIPTTVVILDKLPLTPNGKVDKKGLPEPESLFEQHENEIPTGNPLVNQVRQIWETLLGKAPIRVDANFFDLGGHSLLAVRLMHVLEQNLGVRLPITALLQAPTIEKLTVLMRAERQSSDWSPLIPLQTGGIHPPFFFVHGVGGTVLRFRELSRLLGADQPFYGLQARGLDGIQAPHTTVEEMAAHYMQEVQAIQPNGPYHLGGYSFGGMVALEMAQRLTAEGHDVGLVVLLDTFPGSIKSNSSLLRTYLSLPLEQKWYHLARKAKALPRSVRRRVAMMRLPASLTRVREACYLAGRGYQPRPYDGDVVLFRASEKGLSAANELAAWRNLAPRIEIYEVDGHHGNVVDPPQVQVLATKLRARLQAAFRKEQSILRPVILTTPSRVANQMEMVSFYEQGLMQRDRLQRNRQ